MDIHRIHLRDPFAEQDTSVVIDVLRAFTTAAFAFAAGALEIFPVSKVDDAFALREELGGVLLMGEVNGYPIDGFDLPNSPTALASLDLTGMRIIHRTTSGTQGLIHSSRSRHLLAASLCCAGATVTTIKQIQPESLTFVETGVSDSGRGDEDRACADLILSLLQSRRPNLQEILKRVERSQSGRNFTDPAHPVFPSSDLELAKQVDRFDFAMRAVQEDGHLALRKLDVGELQPSISIPG